MTGSPGPPPARAHLRVARCLAGLALVALIPASGCGLRSRSAKEIERDRGGGAPASPGNGWALLVDGWRAGLMLATALSSSSRRGPWRAIERPASSASPSPAAPPAPAPSSGVRSWVRW